MLTERLLEGKLDGGFHLGTFPEITDPELDLLAKDDWTDLVLDCTAIDDGRLARLSTPESPRRNVGQFGLWNSHLLTDEAIAWIARVFNSVRILHLGDCTKCTNDALNICPDIPKLSELTLDKWSIDGAGLQHLRRINRLQRLTLASLPQFDSAHLAFLQGMFMRGLCLSSSNIDCNHLGLLKGIRGLIDLDLTKIGLTDAGLTTVCQIGTLEVLLFEQTTDVTDAGIARLAALQRLQRLYACCPLLTDEGATTIVGLPNLQDLRLTGAKITDLTVKALGERKELTRLGLIDCPGVTDDSVNALAGLVKLEKLSVRGTAISPAAFQRLEAALPKCKMRMY